jgi:RNA polymerase sigma-70 factor (ECF subfamily)
MSDNGFNPNDPAQRSFNENGPAETVVADKASDELLMNRVRCQDAVAMAEVFDRYSGLVYSVALRVLKDPAQAEDVMQEIFFQLWKGPQSFVQMRGSLGAWLAVVSRNRAIDSLRRRKPTDSVEDVVLASKHSLAGEVEQNLMMGKVRLVMERLPAEQQKLVGLAFFEGLTHSEIAARTGDALGTVKTRIRAALMTLRKGMLE